jgi:acyl carrier protein
MSVDRQAIVGAIYAAIDELNGSLAPERKLQKTEQCLLYGEGAALDSLNLVNLVATVEQQLSERLDLSLVLASEAAMSRKRSPYRSVSALADYALELAQAERQE